MDEFKKKNHTNSVLAEDLALCEYVCGLTLSFKKIDIEKNLSGTFGKK